LLNAMNLWKVSLDLLIPLLKIKNNNNKKP
jgi:hypothetical protein